MPASAVEKIQSSDLIVGVAQKEIRADINQSQITTATGGGLLFALIDSAVNNSRAKDAEKAVVPLRDALLDYNFNDRFVSELSTASSAVTWMKDDTIEVVSDVSNITYDKKLNESKKSTVAYFTTDYSVSPDFRVVKVSTHVNVFPNTEELKNLQFGIYKDTSEVKKNKGLKTSTLNSLYRNNVVYSYTLDKPTKTPEEAAKLWAEDSGKRLKAALDRGIKTVIKIAIDDMANASTSVAVGSKVQQPKPGSYSVTVDDSVVKVTRDAFGTSNAAPN